MTVAGAAIAATSARADRPMADLCEILPFKTFMYETSPVLGWIKAKRTLSSIRPGTDAGRFAGEAKDLPVVFSQTHCAPASGWAANRAGERGRRQPRPRLTCQH